MYGFWDGFEKRATITIARIDPYRNWAQEFSKEKPWDPTKAGLTGAASVGGIGGLVGSAAKGGKGFAAGLLLGAILGGGGGVLSAKMRNENIEDAKRYMEEQRKASKDLEAIGLQWTPNGVKKIEGFYDE